MKNILVVAGGGRPKGNKAQLVGAFINGAEEDPNPPYGRYEKYPVKDSVLLPNPEPHCVKWKGHLFFLLPRNRLLKIPSFLHFYSHRFKDIYHMWSALQRS